ncbi:hypothetical protein GWI33_003644 [Rhynchophorus ferrugineus]|uniref:Uncharacterized protein n=1 Tax=Rhynchophorus ferrugineus TaxID=354439 RepID=A0A834M0E4_RHYFE|nr:hypothetical protein GWI33_003644 [Rhynchophorus ferrugineus]
MDTGRSTERRQVSPQQTTNGSPTVTKLFVTPLLAPPHLPSRGDALDHDKIFTQAMAEDSRSTQFRFQSDELQDFYS